MEGGMSYPRLFVAIAFYLHENNYYGWNRWPQSDAELIADGIVCVLIALAFVKKGATVNIIGGSQ
jgi:hypothetical protein